VRYHTRSNQKSPRRIESQLALYDCINCDLCIAACPNDAIFAYDVPPVSAETEVLLPQPDGGFRREPGVGFAIVKEHQLAVIHGACNECSNCEVYCPEEGAPFVIKERIFLNREDYDASAGQDGFFREGKTLYARLEGRELHLVPEHEDQRATVTGDGLRLEFTWEPIELHGVGIASDAGPFDTGQLWRMKAVWNAIFHSATPNMVNPDPAGARRTT
jgi:putative selenate reductase